MRRKAQPDEIAPLGRRQLKGLAAHRPVVEGLVGQVIGRDAGAQVGEGELPDPARAQDDLAILDVAFDRDALGECRSPGQRCGMRTARLLPQRAISMCMDVDPRAREASRPRCVAEKRSGPKVSQEPGVQPNAT